MKFNTASATSLFALAAALAATGAAHAQTTPDQTAAGKPTQVDEIVVTANKRSQSVQDVAAAVSALSGETLEQRGITEFVPRLR